MQAYRCLGSCLGTEWPCAKVSMPGLARSVSSPIGLHLKDGNLGAEITQTTTAILANKSRSSQSFALHLWTSISRATQNIMMAATLADGVTVIENAAWNLKLLI